MEGIVEMPLGQQQDLICFYQTIHQQKVYRSWATPRLFLLCFVREAGGVAVERMRYLAKQDRFGAEAGRLAAAPVRCSPRGLPA